jgi:hypothetical protein
MKTLGFKSFVITEEARAKHTLRFFDYEQNEHHDIAKKIRADLEKAWSKIAAKYSPADLSDFEGQDESKYFDKVEFTTKEAKVGRFVNKSSVYPSVKIGGAYDKSVKSECKKSLIVEAIKILEKYMNQLNSDVNGKPFSVSQEDGPLGEVRLKFKTGEYTKTIFMVAIEPGYKFERVYLKDYLDK